MAEAIEAHTGDSRLFDRAPLVRPTPGPGAAAWTRGTTFFEWGIAFGDDRWSLQSSWQIR